ncbi:MAG: hemerythrin domain-containing protein [Nitrosomonadales bacterium]|nr:hemerythrin domain-containing protein [Nitrosomonadales bacterium]
MFPLSSGAAAPGFDHPLEMLHACHGKILRQCDTLNKLAAHLAEQGCDESAQQAAQGILRYFDSAGRFHHQDEELDLFPALRACADADQAQLDALLERLLAEHIVMMSAWEELRATLLRLAEGVPVPLPAMLLGRFVASHTAHIAVEETELLPLAARLLGARQLAQLGRSMAERRGVQPPPGTRA